MEVSWRRWPEGPEQRLTPRPLTLRFVPTGAWPAAEAHIPASAWKQAVHAGRWSISQRGNGVSSGSISRHQESHVTFARLPSLVRSFLHRQQGGGISAGGEVDLSALHTCHQRVGPDVVADRRGRYDALRPVRTGGRALATPSSADQDLRGQHLQPRFPAAAPGRGFANLSTPSGLRMVTGVFRRCCPKARSGGSASAAR